VARASGAAEGLQLLDLPRGESAELAEGSEPVGSRKGRELPVPEVDVVTEIGRHPGPDGSGLGHADALSDDRPGGGLVGAVELHRPQARVARLQVAHDRIALGHSRESGAVHV
jgi:hypothetical protein